MTLSFSGSGSAAANSVFRPSLVVNLQILFDQGLQEKFSPKSSAQMAESPNMPAGPVALPTSPGTLQLPSLTIEVPTGTVAEAPPPEIIAQAGAQKFSKILNIVPRSASIELPGYRQAGTFSIEILHRDLPLDPRVIRALRAEIHLGVVSHTDFSFGMLNNPKGGGPRASVLTPTQSNLVLVGMADEITAEFSDKGAIINIEGRDLRGILLDSDIAPEVLKKIDLNRTIDVVVKDLVNKFHPQGRGIQVAVQPSEWPGGKLPKVAVAGDLTRPQFDADPVVASQAQKGQSQANTPTIGNPSTISYWDLITQWCLLCGGVPYFVGPQLRIRPARSLYDQRNIDQNPFDPQFPYPFGGNQPRKREIGPPIAKKGEPPLGYRRLVFGKDIAGLKFERKFGGKVVPTIHIVSYNGDAKEKGPKARLLETWYPPKDPDEDGRRAGSVGSSGKGAKSEELYFPVYGVKNIDTLNDIAKALHAEIGRQELGGSVTTKNLASFGGSNQDPDLLRIRPGDPVEFRTVDSGLQTYPPFNSELLDHTSKSFEQEVEAVAKRLGDKDLAFYVVASARGNLQQLTRTFRTSNIRFDWDTESGVGIAFDFQNFVEIRYTDKKEAAGTEPPKADITLKPLEINVNQGVAIGPITITRT